MEFEYLGQTEDNFQEIAATETPKVLENVEEAEAQVEAPQIPQEDGLDAELEQAQEPESTRPEGTTPHSLNQSYIEEVFPEKDDQDDMDDQKHQDQEFWSTLIAKREAEYTEEKTNLFVQLEKMSQDLELVTNELHEKDKKILTIQSQLEQKERLLDFFYKEQENQRVELVIYKHKSKELEEKCQNYILENEKLKMEIAKQKTQIDKFPLFQSTNDEFQDILSPMRQKAKVPVLQVSQTTPKKESMVNKLKNLVTSPRGKSKTNPGFFSKSEQDPDVTSPRKMRDDAKRKTMDTSNSSQSPKKLKL